ncbi:hypothetical protein [Spiroplasma clarkii]|uniref:phenylalanine--tRNA ligase subunit beta-related protein n=1 Tax=Spiroplasma clarkii TaxID=2139 RepID=UPI0011BA895E|nr:hypothetical protein [Spiroplasma clarkii]
MNNKLSQKLVRSLALQQFDTKKVLTIDERTLNIYSTQDVWLKFSQAKTTDNFFLDLANAIAIETGQPVLFVDPKKLNKQLEIKDNSNETNPVNFQLMHGKDVVATLGVDFNEAFLPTVDSEQILAIYLSLDPVAMRKQQKSFNSSSVFLQRWMKPISSRLYEIAAKHTVHWLDQYDLYGASSQLEVQIPSKEVDVEIELDLVYLNQMLGIELPFKTIQELFSGLNFEVKQINPQLLSFKVDFARTDISHQAHLVEEIARLYGYNKIPSFAPEIKVLAKPKALEVVLKNQVENYLTGLGFYNVKTYALLNLQEVEKWDLFGLKDPIKLMAPLSKNREAYRLSLSRSLIEAASFNSTKGNKNLKLYEVGDVYNLNNTREKHLAMLVTGDSFSQKAYKLELKPNYAYLKGVFDEICAQYQISTNHVEINNFTNLFEEIHPYINGEIKVNNQLVGFIYKLNPRFEQAQKLDSTFVLELNLTLLEQLANLQVVVNEVSKFQKTSRDVTMLLSDKHQYNSVIKEITKGLKYLQTTSLVDIYQDEALKTQNLQAVSVNFVFNSVTTQLTDEMVSKEWEQVLQKLAKLKIEVK